MFINIKAFLLDSGIHPDSLPFVKNPEENISANKRPDRYTEASKSFHAEEMPATAVKKTSVCSEYSSKDGSKHSADTVN